MGGSAVGALAPAARAAVPDGDLAYARLLVALELLSKGEWTGAGVLGPEAFDAVPFLDLLTEYGSPWGQQELTA